ncbi:MAG: ABC transporter permease [Myxococcota bacterium]|nr:ABC transporter permease [Myxococcota bacterium]
MTAGAPTVAPETVSVERGAARWSFLYRGATARAVAETVFIRAGALAFSLVLFGAFVGFAGADPFDVFYQMGRGSFGSSFSVQNTLLRAAPLMLTALCTAIPARLGLVVIGGEGALIVGGLAATACGLWLHGFSPWFVATSMAVAGTGAGGVWVGLAGALRAYRGVNETISSLLLTYIAVALLSHLVEGPMRDPASLNKPSTRAIAPEDMVHAMPGLDVHWGLIYGVVACLIGYVMMVRSVFGFACSIVGGNHRVGLLCGLPVRRMILVSCLLGGGAAGAAGMLEVAAVHGRANESLVAGYGYTGILVSFMARHNPLGIVPVALLLGGIGASNGLLQRVDHLPDATVSVLQGILFVVILGSETLYGRMKLFKPRASAERAAPVTEAALG